MDATVKGAAGPEQARAMPDVIRGGLGYDWLMGGLGLVFTGGLYLDGWAHNHGRVDESFFTIWHAFLYGSFLLVALVLVGTLVWNQRAGADWANLLPTGYRLSLLGVMVFATGGVGDMIWHELFGIEESFDALFSPTHLMLGIGIGLVVTGPLRAAWSRPDVLLHRRTAGPVLLSVLALISILTFFAMFSHPLAANIAGARHGFGSEHGQIAGGVSVLLTTALLMGPFLLLMGRWQMPLGTLLVIWGGNTVAMAILNWHHSYTRWHLAAMLGAVVGAELLHWWWRPHAGRAAALRRFALLVPMLLMGSYFVALLMTEGTQWTVHLWTGVVVEAGLVGWLLSYLAVPPARPLTVV